MMNKIRINWKIFEGSSHCEEGVCLFGLGKLNYNQWIKWHLPYMHEQAKYIRKIKNHVPLTTARKRARQAAYMNCWMTPGDFRD
jgi:hypothetical protein